MGMEQQILNLITKVEPTAWWFVFKLMVAGVIIMLIKSVGESIVSYLQFLTNKRINIGVKVRVRGVVGVVDWFNIKWIMLKTKKGLQLIPMKYWQKEVWEVIEQEISWEDSHDNKKE